MNNDKIAKLMCSPNSLDWRLGRELFLAKYPEAIKLLKPGSNNKLGLVLTPKEIAQFLGYNPWEDHTTLVGVYFTYGEG